eukprot:Clim_evm24s225 gene=Clim_evmTU24s225
MTETIRTKMKALRLKSAIPEDAMKDAKELSKYITVEEVDVPTPQDGEVLVKVARGTINPNDLAHATGVYGTTNHQGWPRSLGFEGAGEIVVNKGAFYLPARVGQKVAFYAGGGGMFGEYVTTTAMNVIRLPAGVDMETAACSSANPLTTILMVDKVTSAGHKAFINTAAASALGKLLIRWSKAQGVETINLVRREEQAELCRQEGAKYVINSSDPDWEEKLKAAIDETDCHFAYDCVGGTMPKQLLEVLPERSELCLYGNLTGGDPVFSSSIIFGDRKITGFTVPEVMAKMSLIQKLFALRKLTNGMGKVFKSSVNKTFPLDEATDAYAFYVNNMTSGKVQIVVDADMQ